MIFSHAVLRTLLWSPAWRKSRVLFATPATARDCEVAVRLFKRGMRNTSPNRFTSRSRNEAATALPALLIAFGQNRSRSYQPRPAPHHWTIEASTGANRAQRFSLAHWLSGKHFMPGLLRRIADNDRRCRLLRRVGWKRSKN
ncbi:hypothetical protein KCP73_03325 [Salmonella enterica subsp. enterica]|nr:hypothetical protein KCP73_03325 [Salmonella enterica subsp. enterica]